MFIFRVFIFIWIFLPLANAKENSILHASFDVTRELFKKINEAFIKEYNLKLKIKQSHGGSGKQTSSVIYGLPADVVSLALPYHMTLLEKKGLVTQNWSKLFPNNSSPFSTYIVFLIKKGNPKNIKDWNDLTNPGVKVITANPKTSGGALWNYVAAWIYANKKFPRSQDSIKGFMRQLYHNVPLLDSTARNAAVTFLKRNIGDVLITWNSEAEYIISHLNSNYEIVVPSLTVKINIPIAAIINKDTAKYKLANEYIKFMYSEKAQEIIKKFYYQSYDAKTTIPGEVNVDNIINWEKFKKDHFDENGVFEEIYN